MSCILSKNPQSISKTSFLKEPLGKLCPFYFGLSTEKTLVTLDKEPSPITEDFQGMADKTFNEYR